MRGAVKAEKQSLIDQLQLGGYCPGIVDDDVSFLPGDDALMRGNRPITRIQSHVACIYHGYMRRDSYSRQRFYR